MHNEVGVREYTTGGHIRWNLTIAHAIDLNLQKIVATFEREVDDELDSGEGSHQARIVLIATDPRREELKLHPTTAARETKSAAVLEDRVRANTVPREYRCRRVVGHYGPGRQIDFDLEETPDIRFRVVEAPVAKPRITGSEFL